MLTLGYIWVSTDEQDLNKQKHLFCLIAELVDISLEEVKPEYGAQETTRRLYLVLKVFWH